MDTNVIVVGTGLSGLVAARTLQDAGMSVICLDKARGPGGRLATRRIQNGVADHGAQFFTVRTGEFQKQVDEWLHSGHVFVWSRGWSDGSLKRTVGDGHPRYAAKGGMNSLAKLLAESLSDLRYNARVLAIQRQQDSWIVNLEEGNPLTASVVILTAPVPQSLEMTREVELAVLDRQMLERIQYGPCLCGLFTIEGEIDLPESGALQDFNSPIYWIADNQVKGISPSERIITMHVEERYSRLHYDDPDATTLAFIEQSLRPRLKDGAIIKDAQLKKWRYSVPLTTHPYDILHAQGLPLIFAGDAFGGRGRIEGAYLSGMAAGKAALDILT